jgi:hypothetical protein
LITDAQRTSYLERGFLQAPGLIAADACAAMCDAVWRALTDEHGICPDLPETWRTEMPRGLGRHFGPEVAAAMGSPALIGLIDDLLGAGSWDPPRVWAQPLPVFPTTSHWDVPAQMWHLDYPVRGRPDQGFAVKMLCLLAPVEPRGGGTLLLAGSHRLMEGYAAAGQGGNSSDVRNRLCREHPWFRELMSSRSGANSVRGDDPGDRVQRFMTDGTVIDGVPLRVVEFTGAAGDVVLFHPWLLHNVSPNTCGTPRMMVAQNITTRDGMRIYQPDT